MRTRPASMTVIAWILILLGGISLVTTTLMIDKVILHNPAARELISKSPIPVPVQYAMTYVGLLIMFVAGVAMLKGQNWVGGLCRRDCCGLPDRDYHFTTERSDDSGFRLLCRG